MNSGMSGKTRPERILKLELENSSSTAVQNTHQPTPRALIRETRRAKKLRVIAELAWPERLIHITAARKSSARSSVNIIYPGKPVRTRIKSSTQKGDLLSRHGVSEEYVES